MSDREGVESSLSLLVQASRVSPPLRDAVAVVENEVRASQSKIVESHRMFQMLLRQMQAAYAAGLRDGPEACMTWLGNALAGPGNLPSPGADPDWYANDAWTAGPPWPSPPPSNATVCEPA